MDFRRLPKDERIRTISMLAREAAMRHHKRNYGCTEEAAWAWAVENWKDFLDVAIDIAATLTAAAEAEEAAKWN